MPGADLEGLILDRLVRQAGRAVRLGLVVAARGGDDQQVLVNPADLGAGQAGQEGRDGCAQLLRRVEGECRVVAPVGLGPEPLGRAGARVLEGLCCDECEPVGPPDGVPERGLAVQALLVLGETGEVAAPDRPRVLLRGAGVDEQLAAGLQHPGGGGQEAAEVEVVNAVERGDQVQAGGPQRQLFGGRQQRDHPPGVAAAGGPELCQHGRRDVGRGQQRAVRQQSAQQPRVPSRPAAGIQAGDGAAGQELADRAHRRLVGGAQRFIDHGHPLEMVACGHVRCLPALGLLAIIMRSPCSVHAVFTRPAGQEPSSVPGGVRAAHGTVTATGLASPDLMSNPGSAASLRQRQVRLDLVAVAAAVLLLDEVAGCGQVGDDAVGAALGDVQADGDIQAGGDVAQPRARVVCDAHQHPGVAGQETSVRHDQTVYHLF